MKNIIYIYSFLILGAIAIALIINNNPPKFYNSVFSISKETQKVEPKILGYSFKIDKHSSKSSSYDYSYLYGFTYTINNKKYLARTTFAEDETSSYQGYLPLKNISIIINKNNPAQFIYLNKHTKSRLFFWFAGICYVFYIGFLIYNRNKLQYKDFKPEIDKKNIFGDIIKNIWFAIVFTIPLFLIASKIAKAYNGENAENVTGFSIVNKIPFTANQINSSRKYHSDSYDLISHRSLSTYSDDLYKLFSIATLKNFSDTTVKECYVFDKKGNKIWLKFKYNKGDLDVYMQDDIDLKTYNIYIIANEKKYIVPFDLIGKSVAN